MFGFDMKNRNLFVKKKDEHDSSAGAVQGQESEKCNTKPYSVLQVILISEEKQTKQKKEKKAIGSSQSGVSQRGSETCKEWQLPLLRWPLPQIPQPDLNCLRTKNFLMKPTMSSLSAAVDIKP